MNDPIKILFKYKNNNRKYQYNTYIYVGPVSSSIKKILGRIKDLNFIDTLTNLEKTDISQMEKIYGDKWYNFFFNNYHITFSINSIKNNNTIKNALTKKMGKEWLELLLDNILTDKQIYYTYDTLIANTLRRRKMKSKIRQQDENDNRNYRTNQNVEKEGGSIDFDNIELDVDTFSIDNDDLVDGDTYEDLDMEIDEELEQDDMSIDDIEKIYQDMDVNVDKNISKTAEMISKAMDDDNVIQKTKNEISEFDITDDDNMEEKKLNNIFNKNYIFNQYIFKDDTIKTIKNKICASIKNNPKFGEDAYIIPSRQYLFSEYKLNNETSHVMIGQKWVTRTSLLKIDTQPVENIKYYENLQDDSKFLRDNILKMSSKIKREDDDFNILHDYDGYYTNNEIYLLDIYNEFGKDYDPSKKSLQNLSNLYIRLYFPRINQDDIKNIIYFLQGEDKTEEYKLRTFYNTILNDLITENKIMFIVNDVKKNKYEKFFKENKITQSNVHVDLFTKDNKPIDLLRIFNNFILDKQYPFMQYQINSNQIIYKYNQDEILKLSNEKKTSELLSKWFENSPYGISFKIKSTSTDDNKFMAINLNDNGRLEYKTQWKENDNITVESVLNTYKFIRELINKINKSNKKFEIILPNDYDFRIAFINSIQKFELPDKYIFNHNDFSDFCRFFYPYISLVIEPKKRQAIGKASTVYSKYGTYLRYKRTSKYENQARIEQKILNFLRNYDFTNAVLADNIAKLFNITIDRAEEEIERVKQKHKYIKRVRKILKKSDDFNIKYKSPGIGVSVQGKERDNYKIRISGARDIGQMNRILDFMNTLIYLYIDTYIYKNPERNKLKKMLKNLTNVAKRRNKVEEIVDYEKEQKKIKQMTLLDKQRIGFKPEKGQHQWSKSCQNSGKDKRRQPIQHPNVDDLLSHGFTLNKDSGLYEKTVTIGKKKKIIRAVNPGGSIYYSCNPTDNGEHAFVGFLSKGNNPFGQCMPCCFKIDPYLSKNEVKKNFFLECINKKVSSKDDKMDILDKSLIKGETLYILQDTNKIQDGRLGYLPKHLDHYFNKLMNKSVTIKQHRLTDVPNGYYFKYGVKQFDHPFLAAVGTCLDISVDDIKKMMIDVLLKDKSSVYTSLNNGDIKSQFGNVSEYIKFIENNSKLGFKLFNDLISLPNVVSKHGLNIIVFEKNTFVVKNEFDKEKIIEDFTILCQNNENLNNIEDPSRTNIILLKENKNYYPIVFINKVTNNIKSLIINKIFTYQNNKENTINHIMKFVLENCKLPDLFETKQIIAKKMYKELKNLGEPDYLPITQFVDTQNKCKYLITKNSTIISVKPSGCIYNLPIVKNINTKIQSFKKTYDNLKYLHSKNIQNVNPIGVYYSSKTKNNLSLVSIMTELKDSIPIIEETMIIDNANKLKLQYERQQLYDAIDDNIIKGVKIIDKREIQVNRNNYENESYELFRLEFSLYLNKNPKIKEMISNVVDNHDTTTNKIYLLKKILYRELDKGLYDILLEKRNDKTGGSKFVNYIDNVPNTDKYVMSNDRFPCNELDKDKCSTNIMCRWKNNKCVFSITKTMFVNYINKVTYELAQNNIKTYELLNKDNYYVSDIVDNNNFTHVEGNKIIKSNNVNINNMLSEIFGKGNIPIIGKRNYFKPKFDDYEDLNISNPIQNMGKFYVQNIIENNITVYRAYTNGYNWIKHDYYSLEKKNLGFYSNLQTEYSNYFRSVVVDWLRNVDNFEYIDKHLKKYIPENVNTFINEMYDNTNTSNGIVEYIILSIIYNIPIIIYNSNNEINNIFDNGLVDKKNYSKYDTPKMLKNSIVIQFAYGGAVNVFYYK